MTPVTESETGSGVGKVSISSCLKCEKVISLVDQLTKNMHEFEIVTMEMEFEFDIESAKAKSEKVLSNFWQLISMIKSIKIMDEKEEIGTNLSGNHNVCLKKNRVESRNIENVSANDSENEPVQSKSKSADKTRRRRPNLNLKPNPKVTEKRLIQLERTKRLLRTVKCETPEGFYNLLECTKCQRQFNRIHSARRHVQNIHLNLGTRCPTCSSRFLNKKSLELHISTCYKSKQNQFSQIKVWLKSDWKNPVQVQLQPHQKQQQKQKQVRSTRNQSSGRKIQNQSAERKNRNPVFDLSRLKVRNPYPNFSIVKAMNVKVVIQRLGMEKSGEISSSSQTKIQTTEKTGKERNSPEGAVNDSCLNVE